MAKPKKHKNRRPTPRRLEPGTSQIAAPFSLTARPGAVLSDARPLGGVAEHLLIAPGFMPGGSPGLSAGSPEINIPPTPAPESKALPDLGLLPPPGPLPPVPGDLSALPAMPGVPQTPSLNLLMPGSASPSPAQADRPLFGADVTDVNQEALLALYDQKRFGEVAKIFLKVLGHFEKNNYEDVSFQLQARIDKFVEVFLYILTKPDFGILNELAPVLISHNHIITNLVAISSFRTTDPQIRILMNQAGNLVKLLMLYSPQNSVRLETERLFQADPYLASLWYMLSPVAQDGHTTETAWKNLSEHVRAMDENFVVPDERIAPIYFLSTYWNPDNDHLVKGELNRKIRRQLEGFRITNRPDPNHVAILTEKWFPASAVYKSSYPFIAELAKKRRLTLIHFGPMRKDLDTSLFDEVRNVTVRKGTLDMQGQVSNDYQVAYYPDIGMNPESIWLSNLRLAPIQVMGYGHPVSTFGSRIDYFIGGADVEIAADARRNYSERLVLIPGIGAHPVYPDYVPQRPVRTSDLIWINCSWGYAKFNYPMIRNLQEIRRRVSRPIRFQFFPSWSVSNYNAMCPFRQQAYEALGDAVLVVGNQPYQGYMQLMERAHLSVDSFPFGGYNTIVDSLHLARPVVTYEGNRFYNRAASALLRRIGLGELIAGNDEEYIERTVRLIEDDDYREELTTRLASMNLRERIFDTAEPEAFVRAIDYLIDQDEVLKQDEMRAPIFIQ
ncbi:MAG: hypothetical protein JW818_11465 [Pirellulales bacterium]|nr:hypothetical protein [Pirellulales bacterium]